MTRSTILGLTATILLTIGAGTTQAGLLGTYAFDETGKASWTGTGGQPPAGTAIDGGGVRYDISVTGGDLTPFLNKTFGFIEPDSTSLSDVVLISGAKTLDFFSAPAPAPGGAPLADLLNGVELSTKFPKVDFMMNEVGPENGLNGVTFNANVGNGNTIRFRAISDTPEPSTIVMASIAAICLTVYGRSRMRRFPA